MNKLEMANQMALMLLKNAPLEEVSNAISTAWQYADAMQSEADKREKEESEKKRADIREMLKDNNTFVEREGQHFDDVCSDEMQAQRDAELYGTGFLKVTYDSNGVKYKRVDPETIYMCSSNIGIDSQVLKEWQPDWSQAPDSAMYWAMDGFSKKANWYIDKPYLDDDSEVESEWNIDLKTNTETYMCAPSFNYQGNWQDSLRKRPQ